MRDLRTFIRYRRVVTELEEGVGLLAGRAEHCDVVLDDALASREHCRFEADGEDVVVIDLGSRNGLLINGLETPEPRAVVHHGDIVTAGGSQLTISRQAHEPREVSPRAYAPTQRAMPAAETGSGNRIQILSAATHSCLADDDIPGAESAATNLFITLRGHLSRGLMSSLDAVDEAATIGLDLAVRSRDASWLDRVLELYLSAGAPMDDGLLDRFLSIATDIGRPRRALAEYLEMAELAGAAAPSLEKLAPLR